MPFVSEAQRGYLFANHPKIAEEFAEHTPKGKKLPEHVADKNAANEQPQSLLERLQDPSQWVIRRNVPIFDEHTEQSIEKVPGPDGKPIEMPKTDNFDVASLQQHAENCNRLAATGNPPGLTLGHTNDEGPEDKQPITVGYGMNYRVVFDRNLGRNVIVCDEYYDPKMYKSKEVPTYPYRSVERWKTGRYFKPIALLRREPRRNLGVNVYHRCGGDSVTRYSMEYPSMPDAPMTPPPAAPAASPSMPPPATPGVPDMNAMEPSDKDKELFSKLVKHYFSDPANCEQMKKYMGGGAAGGGAGMPSGSNTGEIKMQPEPDKNDKSQGAPSGDASKAMWANSSGPGQPDDRKHAHEKWQANTAEVARYQADLAARDNRIAALEKESRVARYSAALSEVNRTHVVNVADELTDCQDYDAAQFGHLMNKIKANYAKRPVGGPIRLHDSEAPVDGNGDRPMTKEQFEKADKYMKQHNTTDFWEAVEKTGGKRPNDTVVRAS